MGIPFTLPMGFLFTATMGKLFTMTLKIQLTVSTTLTRCFLTGHRSQYGHQSQSGVSCGSYSVADSILFHLYLPASSSGNRIYFSRPSTRPSSNG